MYHLHTPSKHGRTVVIFIKKIWAQISAFWAFGVAHLELSFGQPKPLLSRVLGFWLPPEESPVTLNLSFIFLVCRPAPHLGPKISFSGAQKPMVLSLTKLEALVPLILEIGQLNYAQKTLKIVIINPSQMSSISEQQVHNQLLRQVLVQIHKLGPELNLEILLFEQKELLSNKNSALFERLFMSK